MVDDDQKWEEHETEIETLKCIFNEEEFTLKREKPYNFEILVNSNTESQERNFLKLKLIFDLPENYPNEIPYFRIKNLSPEYIDNNAMEVFENEMRARATESIGQMMIFEMVDLLKERITTINEKVLGKLDAIEEAQSIANVNTEVLRSDATRLNYTPVNETTFAIWCEQYKEKLRIERELNAKGNEDKPTGKQLFLANRSAFDDITLEMTMAGEDVEAVDLEEIPDTDAVEEGNEEVKDDGEQDEEVEFVYDRALYDANALEEEVDFDD